jgi:hypothetical protein
MLVREVYSTSCLYATSHATSYQGYNRRDTGLHCPQWSLYLTFLGDHSGGHFARIYRRNYFTFLDYARLKIQIEKQNELDTN